ncbi:transcription initiation factor TFIID subunit 8-like [Dysidea avara]|uniref:transcription initiation factor TFIID subunit 8-like n=1 Tax=Dysidea avara TaxID=196820 RepID=UPI003326CD0A
MDDTYVARRKALTVAVAALCLEAGYGSATDNALATFTEMIQSYITEIGRLSQAYAEVAFRTQPTLADVHMSLVAIGGPQSAALVEYAKRPNKRHLTRQLRNYPPQSPKGMPVGPKLPRSSNMPDYLPSLPDAHTFISTPTYLKPNMDYKQVREQLAMQKESTRRGLSQFLAKTRPSRVLASGADPTIGSTCLIIPMPPEPGPVYLTAIMPTDEDRLSPPPPPLSSDTVLPDSNEDSIDVMDTTTTTGDDTSSQEEKDEAETSTDNPFLRPPKRMKLRLKL